MTQARNGVVTNIEPDRTQAQASDVQKTHVVSLRVTIVAAALALMLCSPRASAMPPQAANAWQQDLKIMATEMAKTHKNIYHSISAAAFASMVAKLNAAIPSLSRAEVIVGMAQIVAAVGDGHTNIYPTRDPQVGFHSLPVAFTFFGHELYIRSVAETQRSILGGRVLRIGNLDTDAAYAAVETMVGHEND